MIKNETLTRALSLKARAAIVKAIKQRVRKNYVNVAGVDLASWTGDLDNAVPELLRKPVEDFEADVRERLKALKSSHTAFYHGVHARFLPQHSINATLKSVGTNGTQRWMFLDVFPEGPAETAGISPGQTLLAIDGAPALPPEMPVLKTGQIYRLLVSGQGNGKEREVSLPVPFRKGTKQRPPIVEPVAVTHSVVEDKIGVLRIPYFSGAAGMRFGAALAAAVGDLNARGVDRLIVDLRGNIGGSLGFSMLASYMCPDRRPIGYSITPQGVRKGIDKEKLPRVPMPRTKPSLLMTLAEFALRDKSVVLMTQGLGRQPFQGRIAVLINEWTNSAGEMVASFAKENGLATLVGTKTAGNVLGAANFGVGEDYWLRLPVFGWMTWQGACLEGTGVEPDIALESDPDLLGRGADPQMDHAVRILSGM
jgi:C-terminal processing protease CtpA/Prc